MAKPTHKVTRGDKGISKATDHSATKKPSDNQSHGIVRPAANNQSYKN